MKKYDSEIQLVQETVQDEEAVQDELFQEPAINYIQVMTEDDFDKQYTAVERYKKPKTQLNAWACKGKAGDTICITLEDFLADRNQRGLGPIKNPVPKISGEHVQHIVTSYKKGTDANGNVAWFFRHHGLKDEA